METMAPVWAGPGRARGPSGRPGRCDRARDPRGGARKGADQPRGTSPARAGRRGRPEGPRTGSGGRRPKGRTPNPRDGYQHIAAEGPAPCYLDPMIENSKLTVIGAGAVGSSVAYAALIRGSARHITLYDIAAEKTEAEVLDLAHGTLFTGSSESAGGSDIAVAEGSHVVVITAVAKQRAGQTRVELAATNAKIMGSLVPQVLEVAPRAIIVIVTNPCDVLTMLAQEISGLPPERIFASGTVLDSSRLRWEIARRAHVSP